MAVHGSSQTGKEVGVEKRFRSVSIPRRLAQSKSRQGSPPRVDAKSGNHLSRTRAVSEHSKVRTSATTGKRVPRGKARLDSRQSFRHGGTSDKGEESRGGNGQLRPGVVTKKVVDWDIRLVLEFLSGKFASMPSLRWLVGCERRWT